MIRARPTQITLNSRDIDWHYVRHENRQGQRARGQPIQIPGPQVTHSPSPPPVEEEPMPFPFPRPPSQLPPVRGMQVPTFATDQDMNEYWSRIRSNAGGFPEVQSVISGRPVMMSTSPTSLSAIEASSASFESDDRGIQDIEDEESDGTDHVPQPNESGHEVGEEERKVDSEIHLPIRSVAGNNHDNEAHEDQLDPTMVQSPHVSRRHRLGFSFRRRRRDTLEQIDSLHRRTENAEYDGSSDRLPAHHTRNSGYSATESQYATAPTSLQDDPLRIQESSTESAPVHNDLEVRHITELLADSSPFMDASDLSFSKSPPLPRQLDFIRRSSGVAGSPLRISETVVSSSPEKRQHPSDETVTLSESLEGLSLQPRRAKRYKRRSQSYPYVRSEADNTSHGSHNDSGQDIFHSTLSDFPVLQLPVPADSQSRQVFPISSDTSPNSHASSEKPKIDSPARRSASSPIQPFTPRRSPVHPPPALPTHPFSAVRRTVSFASPSPSPLSSSPSPSRVQHQTPPYSFNSLPTGQLRTPPPRTPQYVVYDDHLPAFLQPQTPVGLPSNGVPSSGLPGVNYGSFTAPVGGNRRSLGALRDGGNRVPATPTRRGRGGAEQENARYGWDMDQGWRRQASSSHLAEGNEEDE